MASDWQVVSPTDNSWQQVQSDSQSPIEAGVEKTGLYNIPVLGGILRGMVQPSTQMADQAVSEQGKFTGSLFGLNMPTGTKTYANAIQQGGVGALPGAMAKTIPSQIGTSVLGDVPALATGLKDVVSKIPQIAKLATQKGAIAAQQTGASRGADILISDIEKEASKIAGDKHPKEVMDQISRLMSRLRGDKLEIGQGGLKPSLTTKDVLDWRKQLDSELPKTFWEHMGAAGNTVTQAKNKATGIVRTALTNALHESAPGTVAPDKILGTYANIGGDIPSILKKLGIGLAIDRTAKLVGGPQAETGVDILTVLKMLGKI